MSPALGLTKYKIRRNNPRHFKFYRIQIPKLKGFEKTFKNRVESEKMYLLPFGLLARKIIPQLISRRNKPAL